MKFPTERDKVEELILDYALENNMYQVIQAFTANKGPEFFLAHRGSTIPDGRIFSPTIHMIVECGEVQHFHKVIRMLTRMYEEHLEAVPLRKFSRVMVVLKMKALLYDLSNEFRFSKLFSRLDEYFPEELKTNIPTSEIEKEMSMVHTTCRRAIRTIILSQPEERIRIKESLEKKYDRKFMQKFQRSIKDLLKKFNACLPIPILQQVVNEVQCSQSFHSLPVSQTSLLDSLVLKCFESAPSEDMLLSILDKVWSVDKGSQQTEYVGESQIFNFLCSSSSMASQASQGDDMVHQLLSQLEGVSQNMLSQSNESSINVISPSLKTCNEESDKCSRELLDSSSESSKSIRILGKLSAGSLTQNQRKDNVTIEEPETVDPRKEKLSENTHCQQLKEHLLEDDDSQPVTGFTCDDGDYQAHNMSTTSNQRSTFFILTAGTDLRSEQPVKLFVTPKNISMSNIVDVLYEILESCTLYIGCKSDEDLKTFDNAEQSENVRESVLKKPEERQSMFEFFSDCCHTEVEHNTKEIINEPSINDSQAVQRISKPKVRQSPRAKHVLTDDVADVASRQHDQIIRLDSRFSPEYTSSQTVDLVDYGSIDSQEHDDDQRQPSCGNMDIVTTETPQQKDISSDVYPDSGDMSF